MDEIANAFTEDRDHSKVLRCGSTAGELSFSGKQQSCLHRFSDLRERIYTRHDIAERRQVTKADLYSFLVQPKLGVLSTIGETNIPQSALVGIAVTEGLEIVFDTVKNSRKYPNLMARPECSFVIGWAGEQTVQYEGRAEELSGIQTHPYQEIYFHAWPECRAHLSWPGIVYFVVRPRWIRYSDFNRNPPLIQEFTF